MINSERFLTRFLDSFCADRGVALTRFSDDWFFLLERHDNRHIIFGYDLGLNLGAVQKILDDKSAAADLLTQAQIPCVPHQVFHSPALRRFIPMTGNWDRLLDYFTTHHSDVVCKPVNGTGGQDVVRARSQIELEEAVGSLFERYKSIALSPFLTLQEEYRVITLRGETPLIYRKDRPCVTGDGRRTVGALCAAAGLSASALSHAELAEIPAAGARTLLSWKHNLGGGAAATITDPSDPRYPQLRALAVAAAERLGAAFCSVDIVIDAAGAPLVIEVNSGVMLESFARSGPEALSQAEAIYRRALAPIFPIP